MHWAVPASSLRAILPAGVDVEEFDRKGWLGLALPDVRPLLHYADRLEVVAPRLRPVR